MADRQDHFAKYRTGATPQVAPEDAPTVLPDLVEYLEATFPHPYPDGSLTVTRDDQVFVTARLAQYAGVASVIAHLKSLLQSQ